MFVSLITRIRIFVKKERGVFTIIVLQDTIGKKREVAGIKFYTRARAHTHAHACTHARIHAHIGHGAGESSLRARMKMEKAS
jgi:hypothetical protein